MFTMMIGRKFVVKYTNQSVRNDANSFETTVIVNFVNEYFRSIRSNSCVKSIRTTPSPGNSMFKFFNFVLSTSTSKSDNRTTATTAPIQKIVRGGTLNIGAVTTEHSTKLD